MTPDRTRDTDTTDETPDPRNADGVDQAAGGADSSPHETESSVERAGNSEGNAEKSKPRWTPPPP